MKQIYHRLTHGIGPAVVLLLTAPTALPQLLSFGVKGGISATSFLAAEPYASASATTNRYIAGGTVELHLPFRLAIELDGLYRHFHYSDSGFPTGVPEFVSTEHVSSNAWELPLLLKYRFGEKPWRAYVTAGPTCDILQGLKDSYISYPTSMGLPFTGTASSPVALANTAIGGISASGGIDLAAGILHISPEIRYTRWLSAHFSYLDLLESHQNQLEFLVGVTF